MYWYYIIYKRVEPSSKYFTKYRQTKVEVHYNKSSKSDNQTILIIVALNNSNNKSN